MHRPTVGSCGEGVEVSVGSCVLYPHFFSRERVPVQDYVTLLPAWRQPCVVGWGLGFEVWVSGLGAGGLGCRV